MLKQRAIQLQNLLVAVDFAVAASVFLVLAGLEGMVAPEVAHAIEPVMLIGAGLLAALAWPLTLDGSGTYGSNRRESLSVLLVQLLVAGCVPVSVLCVGLLALGQPNALSFSVHCVGFQLAALGTLRLGIYVGLRILRRGGRNYRNVLIVGSGSRAVSVRDDVRRHPEWGMRIIGFLDETDYSVDERLAEERVHKLVDFSTLLAQITIDEVILAVPRTMLGIVTPVVAVCASTGVPVTLPSDLFGDVLPPPQITRFHGRAALRFAPVHHSRAQMLLKRCVDVVGACLLLPVVLPVLAVSALLIRASSPGPVFFRQVRCGLHGRSFVMLKLRTMKEDAESRKDQLLGQNEMSGPVFKLRDDPRVTPVGRVLRRLSLDELPQLWNVLRGEMSLVGPRPAIPVEVAQYSMSERRRLSMRPGLTCIWQVSGRNTIGFADWVKLDLEYIDTWSIAKDLKLLMQTVPAVILGTGAS